MRARLIWIAVGMLAFYGCTRLREGTRSGEDTGMTDTTDLAPSMARLRAAYAAFNRGDMDAAVSGLDPQIEWSEPTEFPGGGAYHGRDAVKGYLTQSRANWAEGASEPEQMIPAGDRVVVMVHARFRLKDSETWQDVKLADVYTVRAGKIVAMQAFADRREALRWVGK
jgi:ketosteroid isomerase-like protein